MASYLVNIGNTHTQICFDDLSGLKNIPSQDFLQFASKEFKQKDKIFVATVVNDFLEELPKIKGEYQFLSYSHLDINFSKVKADTIGADRLANIAAVSKNKENVLILDCGTCITGELLTSECVFKGGFIMPGRNLSRKALNSFTSQLPIVPLSNKSKVLGKDTEGAIQVGVDTMSGFALQKYVEELNKSYSNLKVVLTGGDADYFSEFISSNFNLQPLLTLKGLRSIFIDKI